MRRRKGGGGLSVGVLHLRRPPRLPRPCRVRPAAAAPPRRGCLAAVRPPRHAVAASLRPPRSPRHHGRPCSPRHRGCPCSPAEGAPRGSRRCHGYGPELDPHARPREGRPAAAPARACAVPPRGRGEKGCCRRRDELEQQQGRAAARRARAEAGTRAGGGRGGGTAARLAASPPSPAEGAGATRRPREEGGRQVRLAMDGAGVGGGERRRGAECRSRGGLRRPPPQAAGAHGLRPLRARRRSSRSAASPRMRAAVARGPRRGEVAAMAPRGRGEAPQRRERG